MPEDSQRINQALIKASLLKRNQRRRHRGKVQLTLDFHIPDVDLKPMEAMWRNALEKTKTNRTVFAQRRLKPEEVLPEWARQRALLGEPRMWNVL